MGDHPSWLDESLARAASTFGGDPSASTFLTVAFYVQARVQGVVHLAVSRARATPDDATRFASALDEALRRHQLIARVVWAAVTHGPHAGERQGALVTMLEVFEPPKALENLHINQSLTAVQKLSETSVLAVGDQLRDLQQLATSQVNDLKHVAKQLSEEGTGAETLATTFDRLAGGMRAFGQDILERTERQASEIEQARAWTAEIVKLGQAIARIAAEARMLTFNARLESARLGESGRGFSVIATSIHELATQVRTTNDGVSDLAMSLASTLPQLGAESRETSARTKDAVSLLETQLAAVQTRLTSARTQSFEAIAASSNAARDLELRVNTALEHLQFQDRASQMLQEAITQVQAVTTAAGFIEKRVDDKVIEQVGVLGRALSGDICAEPGTVAMF